MISVGMPLIFLSMIHKGCFFSIYSIIFSVLCLWSMLRFSSGVCLGQIFAESYFSHGFLLLSLWLGVLVYMMEYQGAMKSQFCNLVYFVCSLCCMAFMCMSGMVFFLVFELVFVPVTSLVLIWGYNKERISAALYMVTYSSFGSGFHLVSLMGLEESMGSVNLGLGCLGIGMSMELFLWWAGTIVLFLIKAPLFMFHLWLPKAHVEAPTCASMLLAGLLLKLGVYGLMMYEFFWQGSGQWVSFWQVFGLWGGVYSSLLCLREQNVKKVVALSSVSHMSMSVAAFFVGLENSWDAMYLMGIMHGFCSSGLFSWAGLNYYQSCSQSSFLVSGYRSVGGLGGVFLLVLLVGVAGMPPVGSFWAEYYIYASLLNSFFPSGAVLFIVGVLNLLFLCYLGLWVCHGEWGASSSGVYFGGDRSFLCMLGHLLPCVILFFFIFLLYL